MISADATPSVALVYDWITVPGGGEKVLEQLIEIFPNSELFMAFLRESSYSKELVSKVPCHVSKLNSLPFVQSYYKNLLLLAARAMENFDVSKFDVVISSSAAISRGVITAPHQPHIGYAFSPARYAWDLSHEYRRLHGVDSGLKGLIAREMMHRFRIWDSRTINGVDVFLTISEFVRQRSWKVYRRDSLVLYPPVDTNGFNISRKTGRHFVTASRLVGYKRVDILVQAFSARSDLKLVVIGEGPELDNLKSMAGPNVEFVGRVSTDQMFDIFSESRAFLYAALEDFGISPIEAQAAGLPVIAYGRGGSLETIIGSSTRSDRTGLFYSEQTPEGVLDAIRQFELIEDSLQDENIRKNADRFSIDKFQDRFKWIVKNCFDLASPGVETNSKLWHEAQEYLAKN